MVRKLLLILLLILLPYSAWATNYYISAAGSGSSCTSESPCALATAVAAAGSNDTIFFKSDDTWTNASVATVLDAVAGVTYDGSTYGSGTRAKILTGHEVSYGHSATVSIGVSNVTFKGFDVDGDNNSYNTYGIYIGEGISGETISSITIDNCVIHHTGKDDWSYGILVSSKSATSATISNVSITNSTVRDNYHEGIAIYQAWGYPGNNTDTVLVRNCTVYNNLVGVLIANDSDDVTVEYCNIHDNTNEGIWVRTSPEGDNGYPDGFVIRYNLIYENPNIGFTTQTGLATAMNGSIYGNLFYNNGEFDLSIPHGDYNPGTFNIYNNTFYNTVSTSGFGVVNITPYSNAVPHAPTVNFKNNIIYSSALSFYDHYGYATHSDNLIYRASGNAVTDNGSSYTSAQITNWDETAIGTSPAFSGGTLPTGFSGTYGTNMIPNTDYFQLTVDSPAKDTGATLASYTGSINGAGLTTPIVRPLGAAFDIGAYEYGTVAQSGGSAGSGLKFQGVTIK